MFESFLSTVILSNSSCGLLTIPLEFMTSAVYICICSCMHTHPHTHAHMYTCTHTQCLVPVAGISTKTKEFWEGKGLFQITVFSPSQDYKNLEQKKKLGTEESCFSGCSLTHIQLPFLCSSGALA